MKTRRGFVANSSSSSFVVSKADITPLQVILIKHHSEVGAWLGIGYADDAWRIYDYPIDIEGHTDMDNFRMRDFLVAIGVNMDNVDFGRS